MHHRYDVAGFSTEKLIPRLLHKMITVLKTSYRQCTRVKSASCKPGSPLGNEADHKCLGPPSGKCGRGPRGCTARHCNVHMQQKWIAKKTYQNDMNVLGGQVNAIHHRLCSWQGFAPIDTPCVLYFHSSQMLWNLHLNLSLLFQWSC